MTKDLKLITESTINDYELITESANEHGPKTIKMKGVYIAADIKNGNNRIYKYEDLKPTVDKFIEEKVKTNRALEELEHPAETTINPQNVCCKTVSLTEDNKSWIGESVVLASQPEFGIVGTKNGDLLYSLLQHEVACGHSTRGVGQVDESTGIVTDYNLLFIDTVLEPSLGVFNKSNANRFVNGILESKSFIVNVHGEVLEECYKDFEKDISTMPNTYISSKKAEYLGAKISEFLKSINSK